METQRVFVNPSDDTTEIKCSHCGAASIKNVGKFKGTRRRIKVKCKCQEVFAVQFEFRKETRKDTDIVGHYARLPEQEGWRQMLVTNLSQSGIGFLTQSMHNLSAGDRLKIRFNLIDQARRSIIEKEAVVRWVRDIHIGCQFMTSFGRDESF